MVQYQLPYKNSTGPSREFVSELPTNARRRWPRQLTWHLQVSRLRSEPLEPLDQLFLEKVQVIEADKVLIVSSVTSAPLSVLLCPTDTGTLLCDTHAQQALSEQARSAADCGKVEEPVIAECVFCIILIHYHVVLGWVLGCKKKHEMKKYGLNKQMLQ